MVSAVESEKKTAGCWRAYRTLPSKLARTRQVVWRDRFTQRTLADVRISALRAALERWHVAKKLRRRLSLTAADDPNWSPVTQII